MNCGIRAGCPGLEAHVLTKSAGSNSFCDALSHDITAMTHMLKLSFYALELSFYVLKLSLYAVKLSLYVLELSLNVLDLPLNVLKLVLCLLLPLLMLRADLLGPVRRARASMSPAQPWHHKRGHLPPTGCMPGKAQAILPAIAALIMQGFQLRSASEGEAYVPKSQWRHPRPFYHICLHLHPLWCPTHP